MSERCAGCGSTDLLEIELTADGSPVRFSTCRDCEHRWWTDLSETTRIGVADVLQRVRVKAA
jgi:hypothetical protein